MLVKTGQHIDLIAIDDIEQRIREVTKISAPQLVLYAGV